MLFLEQGRKKIAFDLVDLMFEREFFLTVSWTGATTDNQAFPNGKTAFKKLVNTVHLFWKIVNNADKSYTNDDNKAFLSQIMARAKQRVEQERNAAPGVRRKTSAGKNRPSGKKYKKQNDNDGDEDGNIPADEDLGGNENVDNKDDEHKSNHDDDDDNAEREEIMQNSYNLKIWKFENCVGGDSDVKNAY